MSMVTVVLLWLEYQDCAGVKSIVQCPLFKYTYVAYKNKTRDCQHQCWANLFNGGP